MKEMKVKDRDIYVIGAARTAIKTLGESRKKVPMSQLRYTTPPCIARATNYVRQAVSEAVAGKPISVASSRPYGCMIKYKS